MDDNKQQSSCPPQSPMKKRDHHDLLEFSPIRSPTMPSTPDPFNDNGVYYDVFPVPNFGNGGGGGGSSIDDQIPGFEDLNRLNKRLKQREGGGKVLPEYRGKKLMANSKLPFMQEPINKALPVKTFAVGVHDYLEKKNVDLQSSHTFILSILKEITNTKEMLDDVRRKVDIIEFGLIDFIHQEICDNPEQVKAYMEDEDISSSSSEEEEEEQVKKDEDDVLLL